MSSRNPPVVPTDTSTEVWRRQMNEIAALSPEERLSRWAARQAALDEVWRAALVRRHPDYDEHDVVLAATRHFHGDDLVRAAWPDEPLRDW